MREPLDDVGLVHINCNVRHTWMHAYVYVADNPYHGVTGADGRLVLEDVPVGRYTLSVWHEMLGSVDREVSVSSGQTSSPEDRADRGGQGSRWTVKLKEDFTTEGTEDSEKANMIHMLSAGSPSGLGSDRRKSTCPSLSPLW